MIMEAVKRNVCRGVIFLMACLTCLVVFGGGLIAGVYAADTPYVPYTGHVGIHVTKELVGRPFQAGDKFTFKIKPAGNAPAPVDEDGNSLDIVTICSKPEAGEGSNTADIEVDAEFTFNDPGTYVYYISEVQPEKPLEGITYDQRTYRLTIEIAKEIPVQTNTSGEGETAGEEESPADAENGGAAGGKAAGAVSDNEIAASPAPAEDDASQAGGDAAAAAGAGEPSDSGDSADSDASTDSGAAGMETGSEDDSQVRSGGKDKLVVKSVTLEKSTDGQNWEKVHFGESWPDEPYHFINTYTGASVPLTGTKTLEGRKYQKGDTFTFTITPENGAPAPEDDDGQPLNKVTIEPVSGDSAEIDFGTIHFEATDLGREGEKTFSYTITEQAGSIDGMTYDTDPRTVQIQVTREEDGSMTAKVVDPDSDELSWTNTWKDPDEPGGDPGDDPDDDPGDDPRPSYTSLTVNKVWVLDDGGEAPVSVTVELLRNNRVYEEVTLDEDNDWSHTWTRLDARYNWKVQEADVPDGFTAEVSHRGTIWTITNDDIPEDPETPPEEPDEPDTPEDPDTPDEPDIPGTPDEPDVPDTPDTPDEPNTPNEPTLPQTGQNWRLVWILAITGAVLVLVGILGKKGYHGKHEA